MSLSLTLLCLCISYNVPIIKGNEFNPTQINGTWTDDFKYGTISGWTVTDYNNNLTNATLITEMAAYHGPYYGDSSTENIEIYSMTQSFYCDYTASIYVEYFYGFACQEATDYTRLYLNNQLMAEEDAPPDSEGSIDFLDPDLENEVQSQCDDAWHKKLVNATYGEIEFGTSFKLQIDVAMNYYKEASVINGLKIKCSQLTNAPTMNPITLSPTTDPITVSPTVFSTQNPTINPSTNDEITVAPTTQLFPTPNPMNTAQNMDNLGLMPSVQELEMRSSEDKDTEGLIALAVVGGFIFAFVVAVSCKVWIKHEKNHLPLYYQRKQEMLKAHKVLNNGYDDDGVSLELGQSLDKDGYAIDTELK